MDGCYGDYKSYHIPETYNYKNKYKNNAAPVPAGTVRFLFGLLIMFAGLYVGTLTNVTGHGLGFMMVLVSPFILLTDRR